MEKLLETDFPLSEISPTVEKRLQIEVNYETLEISEDARLWNVLISLIDSKCISL